MRLDPRVAIAVATKNKDKFAEIVALWGTQPPALVLPGDEYPDVDEHYSTYEENALLKARELSRITGGPALADPARFRRAGMIPYRGPGGAHDS